MMSTLSGRTAIVTGASRGVGREVALALAAEGAHVVITARGAAALDSVAEEIVERGGAVTAVPGDASAEEDVDRVVAAALSTSGTLDILVNNAGIGILGPLAEMAVDDFDEQVRVNLRSVFLYSRAVIPHLEAQGGGNLVNIASITGLAGFAGASAYSATKWAVVGLSRGLDKELSPQGIKVTAICPAGIDTTWAFGTGIDPEAAKQLDRLSPKTVAESVMYAINQPANARITEVVVYPMSENGHQ
ncbi:SDR family oxidoreductase [Isoptericola sp. b441]|uniref:SDR family oxidoreductase n=1 Tax=Actinotalea lenta TaxID=3064654 RepID=A0ABT9DA22_9CELL|nr:SDR family oxidoreductase [Isoptericola sp. b441]MDO8106151.1 SDR family oxidoreductase [Isoptericola sp. b441]